MNLRPQDVALALKVAVWHDRTWTLQQLARELRLSVSEVHAASARALVAGLFFNDSGNRRRPNIGNLLEFVVHGVPYAFVADRGGMTRGHPTAHAAPILQKWFGTPGPAPPVWPHSNGSTWGAGLSPLYRGAVDAALADEQFYSALALVDALRAGGARERAIAGTALNQLLTGEASA